MTDEATLKALAEALKDAMSENGWGVYASHSRLWVDRDRVAAAILEAEPRLTLADPDEVREMADGELSVIHHPEHTPGCKDGECRTCEGPLMAEQERLAAIGAAVDQELPELLHAALGTHSRPYPTRQICPGPAYHVDEAKALHAAIDAALEDKP